MAFLNVSSAEIGMGVSAMGITISLAQGEKSQRFLTSPDEWIKSLSTNDTLLVDKQVASLPIRVGDTEIGSRTEVAQPWKSQYTEMLDLKGVRTGLVDKSTLWVRRHESVFHRLYIRGIKLRAGVLPSKVRSSRGVSRKLMTSLKCRGL